MSHQICIGGKALPGFELSPRLLARACGHRILYFHHVGKDELTYYDGGIKAGSFHSLLLYLKKAGFSFISLSEALVSRSSLRGTISICSDDGLASNVTTALPILNSLSIPLTLFLVGICIDNRSFAWNHLLALLRSHVSEPQLRSILPGLESSFGLKSGGDVGSALFSVRNQHRDELIAWLWDHFDLPGPADILKHDQPFLSLTQLRELQDHNVDFALHSNSHADLSRLSYPDLKDEIQSNIRVFQDYDLPFQPWLAFPYGRECSMQNMQRLQHELGIQSFFGIRCRTQDNRVGNLLWQRSAIEHSSFDPWRELLMKPLYRRFVRKKM